MKLKIKVQYWAFIFWFGGCFQLPAANVTWSDPATISNQADVCTLWSLDRASHFGAENPVTVNGVVFTPLNAPDRQGNAHLPESLADGQTEVAISGDGDGIFAEKKVLADGLAIAPPEYRALLESGISTGDSACALNLAGLTVGKTYLLQVWINDSRNTSATETLAGGSGILTGIPFNATATDGGTGQYIIGTFVADDEQQTITVTPDNGHPLINAFQLRAAPENAGLVIVQQPSPAANYVGKDVKLSVLAVGQSPLTYQWQKVTGTKTGNLYDNENYSGTTNNVLFIRHLTAADAGNYRVLIRDETGSVVSLPASVSLLSAPAELINVDINNDDSTTYHGNGVLVGNSGFDVWNGLDGRNGFTNAALVDSTGIETSLTLTLSKPREDGYTRDNIPNDLLKDYSPAAVQTVTLNHLEPDSYYNLVVYAIGRAPNEGGVFSGALQGVVHGGYVENDFWVSRFLLDTNYIQNPFAKSDASGVLQFTIKATSTMSGQGFYNGDFNGLQIMKVATNKLAPFILTQPQPAAAYRNQSVTLTVDAAAPPSSPLTFQWQKLAAPGASHLADGINLPGATNRTLTIPHLTAASPGDYRVVISSSSGARPGFGSVTSAVVVVSLIPSPYLINVDIKNDDAPAPVYAGRGVLTGLGRNFWNRLNGRRSLQNQPLLDNDGNSTVVTISLLKAQVDSYTSPQTANNLLKDYSVGHPQTVTLKNLEPNSHYDLVVYSYGAMENEGGVFSGAVTGIAHGWNGSPDASVNTFIRGTNYVENTAALTDASGTLTFTIQPTATAMPKGFYNADFNGLQIMRAE